MTEFPGAKESLELLTSFKQSLDEFAEREKKLEREHRASKLRAEKAYEDAVAAGVLVGQQGDPAPTAQGDVRTRCIFKYTETSGSVGITG